MPEEYCVSCKVKQKMDDLCKVTLKNERKALKGKCSKYGTKMFKFIEGCTIKK